MKPRYKTIVVSAGLAALVASGTANAAAQDATKPSQKKKQSASSVVWRSAQVAGGPLGAIAGMSRWGFARASLRCQKQLSSPLDQSGWKDRSDHHAVGCGAARLAGARRVTERGIAHQPLPPAVRSSLRGDVLSAPTTRTLSGDSEGSAHAARPGAWLECQRWS